MSILIRKVSIDCFYEYCKNGCPFFEKTNNKQEYYCYIDGILKNSINCKKKRIIIDNNNNSTICPYKTLKHNRVNEFGQGFSDCINGLPVQKNNKDYIEGYSKAMLLKKDCDGKKFTNNVLTNNNNNNGLTNSNATTSSTTTIIT